MQTFFEQTSTKMLDNKYAFHYSKHNPIKPEYIWLDCSQPIASEVNKT